MNVGDRIQGSQGALDGEPWPRTAVIGRPGRCDRRSHHSSCTSTTYSLGHGDLTSLPALTLLIRLDNPLNTHVDNLMVILVRYRSFKSHNQRRVVHGPIYQIQY